MAIKKSNYTGGNGRLVLPSPYVANVVTEELVTHVFKEPVAAADILELAYLPPYCRILGATIFAEGTAGTTLNVGFMSGDVGSDDPARTSGTELFSAVDPETETDMTMAAIAAAGKSDAARSIGVRPSATIAADPDTVLHLRIRYATGVSNPV
ncbi:hypothetical protein Q0601_15085 [Paracoccus onubensis]|uniref:hypothetical protein n=1 Tax=Paracoccus onubensis TaxID=1675788 RepID=UPI002730F6DF|nr:hypothetical protein [Paracoccus onubensis]MDP0928509.1 hypothetical protein [Paracoccus onubensis]